MGILHVVSDQGDVTDGRVGVPIDQRELDLAKALEMFISLVHDQGANIEVKILFVDESKVLIYHTYYLGFIPASNPEKFTQSGEYHFFYQFQKNPDDHSNTFEMFLFAVSCAVNTVPWICAEQVLRRVVGGDELAYQPA